MTINKTALSTAVILCLHKQQAIKAQLEAGAILFRLIEIENIKDDERMGQVRKWINIFMKKRRK